MPGPYTPAPLDASSVTVTSLAGYVLTELKKLSSLSRSPERDTAGSVTVTSNYTAKPSDALIRVDASGGAVTITLPAASSMIGSRLTVKRLNAGANAVTVSATDLIDGSATATLASQYARMTVLGIRSGTASTYDIV